MKSLSDLPWSTSRVFFFLHANILTYSKSDKASKHTGRRQKFHDLTAAG